MEHVIYIYSFLTSEFRPIAFALYFINYIKQQSPYEAGPLLSWQANSVYYVTIETHVLFISVSRLDGAINKNKISHASLVLR